jgi:hypothetical protein
MPITSSLEQQLAATWTAARGEDAPTAAERRPARRRSPFRLVRAGR